MIVLIMDRETDWYVTVHATRTEAAETIRKYARTGWIEKQQRDRPHIADEGDRCPETIADCIDWLEAGGEHVKLFWADRGAGLGEEIDFGEAAQDAA